MKREINEGEIGKEEQSGEAAAAATAAAGWWDVTSIFLSAASSRQNIKVQSEKKDTFTVNVLKNLPPLI